MDLLHIGVDLRYAGDEHERRNLGVQVADRLALAQTVADVELQADDFSADEARKSGFVRLALSAFFGLSLVLYVAGFALDNGVLRLVALVGLLFFGVGTAPLQLSERASLDLRLCVAGVVGLSVPLLVGTVSGSKAAARRGRKASGAPGGDGTKSWSIASSTRGSAACGGEAAIRDRSVSVAR